MYPKVENLESARSGRAVPNQFKIYTEEGIYFQSYSTVIAFRRRGDNPAIILDKDAYTYSMTTVKYRNQFLGMTSKEVDRAIKEGLIKLEDLNNK